MGQTNVPINTVQMNGSPVNAGAAQLALNAATGSIASVFQSTHKNDFVSTFFGSNPATGGLTSGFGDAHGSYGPNITDAQSKGVWGLGIKSLSLPARILP